MDWPTLALQWGDEWRIWKKYFCLKYCKMKSYSKYWKRKMQCTLISMHIKLKCYETLKLNCNSINSSKIWRHIYLSSKYLITLFFEGTILSSSATFRKITLGWQVSEIWEKVILFPCLGHMQNWTFRHNDKKRYDEVVRTLLAKAHSWRHSKIQIIELIDIEGHHKGQSIDQHWKWWQ